MKAKTDVVKMTLGNCPFCGNPPDIDPWHGGSTTKVLISCAGTEDGSCDVAPSVTGETPLEATNRWNDRSDKGNRFQVHEYREITNEHGIRKRVND